MANNIPSPYTGGGGGGSGTVTSVAAADTSIVVTGTPTVAPTLATGTLDVIAADHPPAANWSNNSHKITSLANGSAAQDAAAFGQIPTALPPNGSAGGDLGSTYPNPTVTATHLASALPVAQGGTGQGTTAAAYNALSPMTTLGDLEYESGASTASRLAGNTTGTKNFLTQTGTGAVSAAPAWGTLAAGDIPGTLNATTMSSSLTVQGNTGLAAGTTSLAPLTFQSGTLNTSAAAGVVEYDGTAFYATSAASSRQVVDAEQIQVLSGTRTFTNNTSAQAIFNATTNGTLTVQGSTTYLFDCLLAASGFSASSHSLNFGFGGSATFTSCMYQAIMATTAGGNASIIQEVSAAASQITNAGTGTILNGIIRGTMRINAAGTIIPQLTQVTASAAAVVAANSYFRCWPIGSNTVTNVGDWT